MAEDPEGLEEEDADLLDFASGLDFSKFIDDLEFKEQLGALRDRAKRLEKEETIFKEEFVKLL